MYNCILFIFNNLIMFSLSVFNDYLLQIFECFLHFNICLHFLPYILTLLLCLIY